MLNALDLIHPHGRVEGDAMYPGLSSTDLAAMLQVWLDEGYSKAAAITDADTLDVAAKHWAYYRAFDNVYLRFSATPLTSAINDQGSQSMSTAQQERFKLMADAELGEFADLLPPTAVVTVTRERGTTRSESHSFRF